jgi:hypothetical protein
MTGASARRAIQPGRELRKRTLAPDPGPILSAPRTQHPSNDHDRDLGTLVTADNRPPADLYQRIYRNTAEVCRIPVYPNYVRRRAGCLR